MSLSIATLRRLAACSLCSAGVVLLSACGEGETETPSASETTRDSGVGDAMETARNAAQDALGKAQQMGADALASLKAEYAEQLEQHESKVQALKASAKTFSDDKLSGLIESLDEKLVAARDKLSEITTRDEGVTEEVRKLLADIPRLYEQAMARLSELQQGSGIEMPPLPGG